MECGVQLVVFDLGRVLVRICDDWPDACRRAGVEFPADLMMRLRQPTLADLAYRHDIGELDLLAFSTAIGKHLNMPAEQVRLASTSYLRPSYAGGAELIEELIALGVPTACLSNTNESHWRIMSDRSSESHVPLHRLTHRFPSHIVGKRKPDPAFYAHVEQATNIPPQSILFFDDVEENIEAAKDRNWQAWHVDPTYENPVPHLRAELRRRGIAVKYE